MLLDGRGSQIKLMKKTYQRKKISAGEKKEIERLSEALPSMKKIGVTPDYHTQRLEAIILKEYKAKSREDRDKQISEAFRTYADGIFDLNAMYEVQLHKGFEPTKIIKSDNYKVCYNCGGESIFSFNDVEDDKRYVCKGCGAIHIPEGEEIKVYYEEPVEIPNPDNGVAKEIYLKPHNVSDN